MESVFFQRDMKSVWVFIRVKSYCQDQSGSDSVKDGLGNLDWINFSCKGKQFLSMLRNMEFQTIRGKCIEFLEEMFVL